MVTPVTVILCGSVPPMQQQNVTSMPLGIVRFLAFKLENGTEGSKVEGAHTAAMAAGGWPCYATIHMDLTTHRMEAWGHMVTYFLILWDWNTIL